MSRLPPRRAHQLFKAFAALLSRARGQGGRHLLFWHTHGELAPEVPQAELADLPASLRSYARPRSGR